MKHNKTKSLTFCWSRRCRKAGAAAQLCYKGFPTFASNTSPWVDRTAINPGMVSSISDQLPALCMQRVDASWQTVRTA